MSVNPETSNPKNQKDGCLTIAIFFSVIFGISITIFSICAGPDIMRLWHDRQMLAHGLPATGVVISLTNTGSVVNHKPVVEIFFHVTPADGSAAFDATDRKIMSMLAVFSYQPGQIFNVRYDPKDHSQVAIVSNDP